MSFRDIALPLIKRGIPVIPVEPNLKKCLLPGWQGRASAMKAMIDFWNAENPDYNVGCVGKPDGVVILDCDVPRLGKRIESETGQIFPQTFIVRSAGKRCLHIYFKQTDRSRALGNRSAAELFDLQSVDKYVVGPGSKLANGKTYDVVCDAEIADIPDWLCDWIEKYDPKTKVTECELEPVVDDFDIEDFLAWYGIEYFVKGDWYNCYITCPAAGYQHEQSKTPGFFFDGSDFGFNCWATGCPGHGKGVGAVIKMLNENHAPYPKRIWPERELDYKALGIEEADLPTEEAEVEDDGPFLPVPKSTIKITVKVNEQTGRIEASQKTTVIEQPKAEEVPQVSEIVVTGAASEPAPVEQPIEDKKLNLRDMPEDCMYGWVGKKAKELGVPLGYAYPAMIGMSAVRFISCPKHVRPTMYVALIGPIHSGKSQALDRAYSAFEWSNGETVQRMSPSSDRGLAKILEPTSTNSKAGPNAWAVPESRLLLQDELRTTMNKMNIQNSTLGSTLCELWSQDTAGSADKKGKDKIFCRLSIVGGLMANNPEEFAETFGRETNAGLYDRFIYGLAPKWKYTISDIQAEPRCPFPVQVPGFCYDMAHEWRDMAEHGRERLAEIALRVAVITAGMNHESTITRECMQAALNFMTWQEAIRDHYKPSQAEQDKESRVTEAIKNALESYVDGEGNYKWVSWRKLYKNRNWHKYGAATVNRVKKAMADNGTLIEERVMDEEDESGKKMRTTGRVCAG